MNFWNQNKLALRMKEKTVSQNEKLIYFLLYMLMCQVAVIAGKLTATSATSKGIPVDYIPELIATIALILGTYVCYRTNQTTDGEAFIERIICLGIPVTVKIITIETVLSCLVAVATHMQFIPGNLLHPVLYAVMIFTCFLYYYFLNSAIKKAAN